MSGAEALQLQRSGAACPGRIEVGQIRQLGAGLDRQRGQYRARLDAQRVGPAARTGGAQPCRAQPRMAAGGTAGQPLQHPGHRETCARCDCGIKRCSPTASQPARFAGGRPGDPADPAFAPAIGEEPAHCTGQMSGQIAPAVRIGGQNHIAPEHRLERGDAVDCHRPVARPAQRKAGEGRYIHRRQRRSRLARSRFDGYTRQSGGDRLHRLIPSQAVHRPAPALPSQRRCLWH